MAVGKLWMIYESVYVNVRVRDVRVVAALAHVNMVIGVNGFLGPELSSENLDGPIRDNLRVHR